MLNHHQEVLLAIVQRMLWSRPLPMERIEWELVEAHAKKQGVLWMLYPAVKHVKECVPVERLKEWRSIMHSGVLYNEQLNAFQAEMLSWLDSNGIRAAILKGTSVSRYYPYPGIRPLGDIDILIDQDNMSIVKEYLAGLGFRASGVQHGFHAGYYRNEITVEVHYRCSELPESEGALAAMAAQKSFLDCRRSAGYDGLSFPVLAQTHQALMLLLHMERHMQEDGIGLRQLCDWAAFVHGSDSGHWQETLLLLKQCGLFIYAKVITKACVKYLGLPSESAAWAADASERVVDAFMHDVFRGGNLGIANDQKVGSLFTVRSNLGKKHQGVIEGMFSKMTNLAFRKWPISKRYKILLPVYYLYIPLNYVVQSLVNRKTKRNLAVAIRSSVRRQRLYRKLHLYEIE